MFFICWSVSARFYLYDVRLLRESSIYEDIIAGSAIPTKSVALGKFGEITLVTIADREFHRFAWLVKCNGDNARENQQRYFNAKLCSARLVTENWKSIVFINFLIIE